MEWFSSEKNGLVEKERSTREHCTRIKDKDNVASPGRGALSLMAYTGRLRPKGEPFSGFGCIKGLGFHKFRYMKG